MYKKKPLSAEVHQVLKLLMYTMFGLVIVSSGYFFVKTSSTAESGYAIHEGQMRQKTLESENRILKQRLLDAQSLGELHSSKTVSDMIPPDPTTTTYILPKGPLSRKR